MTNIGRSRAEQIIDMSKNILQLQFPLMRVIPDESRTKGDCIIHDVNAGGDPYVGAYFENSYFAVLVDHSCQMRMENGERWIARVLVDSPLNLNNDVSEDEEVCRTPAELMARIATRLSDFHPYNRPYVIYMTPDHHRIISIPQNEWSEYCENGNCLGTLLSIVPGDCTESALISFIAQHAQNEKILRMCEHDETCDFLPPLSP